MTDERQVREDLSYVRAVVDRSDARNYPASLYFLWAVITFFGFAIIDVAPEKTGFYWMIAGPGGGILSGILGWRARRSLGQESRNEGQRESLHWIGMMVAILLLLPLVTTGVIEPPDIPRLVLLLVGLSYWLSGVHMDRRFLPLGAVMAGCYLLAVLAPDLPHLWTITAAVLAASLVAAGLFAAARSGRTT